MPPSSSSSSSSRSKTKSKSSSSAAHSNGAASKNKESSIIHVSTDAASTNASVISSPSSAYSYTSLPYHTGRVVGGSITSYAPCYSGDDQLLCVPCESSVKLYQVRSGELVGQLAGHSLMGGFDTDKRIDGSHGGHSRAVTCVWPHPSNKVQLFTASLDGTIKLWDLQDCTCVSTFIIKVGGADDAQKFDRPPILHVVRGAADLLYLLVDPYLHENTQAQPSINTQNASTSQQVEQKERSCRIILFQLSKKNAFILYKVKDATRLAVDPTLKLLAAISGKTLRIYDILGKRSKSTFKKHFTHNLCTITFHPSEPYLTLGDEKGQIIVLYGYEQVIKTEQLTQQIQSNENRSNQLVTQLLHWHAHKIGSICFTSDGHYMLSGGEEGVLVIWQLETGTKQFIPRLQSNILHIAISHDGNSYSLSNGDNRIKLVSAVSNRVEKVISGLTYSAPSQLRGSPSYLVYNPSLSGAASSSNFAVVRRLQSHVPSAADDATKALTIPFVYSAYHQGWFLNSTVSPGSLQLYDLFNDKQVSEYDLLQRNFLSRTEDDMFNNQPRLESMCLNASGMRMLTTERRSGNVNAGAPDSSSGGRGASGQTAPTSTNDSIVLKFYDWSTAKRQWVLNTRVDPPHSHSSQHLSLSTLLFQPKPEGQENSDEEMAVTIGRDACFKIWKLKKKGRKHDIKKNSTAAASTALLPDDDDSYWNCVGIGHYRSYPTSTGAFSHDGSLLGVAYGQVLTLWDPNLLTLRHTLLHPTPKDTIRYVKFLGQTPFVLTTTSKAMYVWNLLTLSLWWSFELKVLSVCVHEGKDSSNYSGHFAVMVLSPEEEEEDTAPPSQDEQSTNAAHPFRRRRTHLVLFSPYSPVPLRVWPLADARLDVVSFPTGSSSESKKSVNSFTSPILFAQDPHTEKVNKRTATGAASSSAALLPTSLIYVNYKRQLVRFDDIFNEVKNGSNIYSYDRHELSSLAQQQKDISQFESIYGRASHQLTQQQTQSDSTSSHLVVPASSSSASSSSLSSLLSGPSHILPPPTQLFGLLMDNILNKNYHNNAATNNTNVSSIDASHANGGASTSPSSPALGSISSPSIDDVFVQHFFNPSFTIISSEKETPSAAEANANQASENDDVAMIDTQLDNRFTKLFADLQTNKDFSVLKEVDFDAIYHTKNKTNKGEEEEEEEKARHKKKNKQSSNSAEGDDADEDVSKKRKKKSAPAEEESAEAAVVEEEGKEKKKKKQKK